MNEISHDLSMLNMLKYCYDSGVKYIYYAHKIYEHSQYVEIYCLFSQSSEETNEHTQ